MPGYRTPSAFRAKVFEAVRQIPKGRTLTYRQVAQIAGREKAWRAVGNILSRNCDPQVPCHRVIRSDGSVGGYNQGTALKEKKLRNEGAIL